VAQYRVETGSYDPKISNHFEVMMLANNAAGDIVTNNNPLPVSLVNTNTTLNAPWELQVARGKVTGVSVVNVFGYSTSVGSSFITLWNAGNSYVFPTVANTLTIVSDSTSDNANASVLISGVDSSWNALNEVISLNGTSPVTTSNSFLRINSFALASPGTSQVTNVGNITATNGGVTYAYMGAGIGKMQNSYYSVPNGYTFYLNQIQTFGDNTTGNSFGQFRARLTNNNVARPVTFTLLQTAFQTNYGVMRVAQVSYSQKTDIQWQFSVNSGTHSLACIVEGFLIDNNLP
jgi:hypothetical protein